MAAHKHESALEPDTSLTDISNVIEKLPAIMKSAKYKGFTIVLITALTGTIVQIIGDITG